MNRNQKKSEWKVIWRKNEYNIQNEKSDYRRRNLEAITNLFLPDYGGNAVPAALQYGGCNYCRAICGKAGAGERGRLICGAD